MHQDSKHANDVKITFHEKQLSLVEIEKSNRNPYSTYNEPEKTPHYTIEEKEEHTNRIQFQNT